jgi:hypothetical protein
VPDNIRQFRTDAGTSTSYLLRRMARRAPRDPAVAEALRMFTEATTAAPGENQHTLLVNDNIMHRKAEQGTSLTYTLKRLKKEHRGLCG